MTTTEKWTLIVAASAVLFSVVSYLLTHRRELAWKRTEFLFEQSQYLDNDPVLIEVLDILEGRHLRITVKDVFDDNQSSLDAETRLKYRQNFDKLLNFLWRLCYAYLTVRTIKKKEIEGFSWWLWRISEYPLILDYCMEGYEEICFTIEKMRPDWKD